MEQELGNVTWIAVLVGTVAAYLVGWLWYSPMLFVKGWAAGSGVDVDDGSGPPKFAMIVQLLALFLLALVIGITATQDMLITAIVAILAVASFVLSCGGYVGKSRYALAVDAGYVVVAGVIMIVFQGVF